jgi:hypothetical protein
VRCAATPRVNGFLFQHHGDFAADVNAFLAQTG